MTDKIDQHQEDTKNEIRDGFREMRAKLGEMEDTKGISPEFNIFKELDEHYKAAGKEAERQLNHALYGKGSKDPVFQTRAGHPRVYEILNELADLHSRKNSDYAKGGHPLGNFQRRADLYKMYPGLNLSDKTVVAIVDAMKQLDAALWFLSNGHEAQVEGLKDRLRDVAVYSILAIVMEEEKSDRKRSVCDAV